MLENWHAWIRAGHRDPDGRVGPDRVAGGGADLTESEVFGQPMHTLAELGIVAEQCQRV